MDEETKNNLQKQFLSLPQALQDAVNSTDVAGILGEIAKKNQLMIDQAGGLEIETKLILLGLSKEKDLVNNLIGNVGLKKDVAIAVAYDVDNYIFKAVRESLKGATLSSGQFVRTEEEKPQMTAEVHPSREEILKGIEDQEEVPEQKVEIRKNLSPEVEQNNKYSLQEVVESKESKPITQNIPPVSNIVESKLKGVVISPKESIVIEEKAKLPEKPIHSDPYREPLN